MKAEKKTAGLHPSAFIPHPLPHIIRLREPWERQPLGDGTVRYTRRFHRPTGLDARSRVWLVVEGVEGDAEVALNERVLARAISDQAAKEVVGTAHPTRFEITELLRPENVVSIAIRQSPATKDRHTDGFGSVRLEIEEAVAQG